MTTMEVKKDGLRQTQDGIWKLTLTVHPNDMSVDLMVAPMGTIYQVAMVEVEPGMSVIVDDVGLANKRLVTRAVMMCKDVEFRDFLGAHDEDSAKVVVYVKCNIGSLSQLAIEEEAAKKFLALCGEFYSWGLERTYEDNLSR